MVLGLQNVVIIVIVCQGKDTQHRHGEHAHDPGHAPGVPFPAVRGCPPLSASFQILYLTYLLLCCGLRRIFPFLFSLFLEKKPGIVYHSPPFSATVCRGKSPRLPARGKGKDRPPRQIVSAGPSGPAPYGVKFILQRSYRRSWGRASIPCPRSSPGGPQAL